MAPVAGADGGLLIVDEHDSGLVCSEFPSVCQSQDDDCGQPSWRTSDEDSLDMRLRPHTESVWESSADMRYQELERRLAQLESRSSPQKENVCPARDVEGAGKDILRAVNQRLADFEAQIASRLLSMQRGIDKKLASNIAHMTRNVADLEAMAISRLAETPIAMRQEVSRLESKFEDLKVDVDVLKDLAISEPRDKKTGTATHVEKSSSRPTRTQEPSANAASLTRGSNPSSPIISKQVMVPSVTVSCAQGAAAAERRQSRPQHFSIASPEASKQRAASAARSFGTAAAGSRSVARARIEERPAKQQQQHQATRLEPNVVTNAGPCVSLVTGAPLNRHKRMGTATAGANSTVPTKQAQPAVQPAPRRGSFARGKETVGNTLGEENYSEDEDDASPPLICLDDMQDDYISEGGSEGDDSQELEAGTPASVHIMPESPERRSPCRQRDTRQYPGRRDNYAGDHEAVKYAQEEPWFRKSSKGVVGALGRRGTGSTVVSEAAREYDANYDDCGHDDESSDEADDPSDPGQPLPGWSGLYHGEPPDEAF